MRSLKTVLIDLLLTGLSANQAKARDRAVDGLLIGAAVGATVGYIVGNEMNINSYDRAYAYGPPVAYHQQVTYPYPHSPRRYYAPRPYYRDRYRDHYRDHYRDNYRSFYRSGKVCREIVDVEVRYGRYYETYRTVCSERDNWHRPRYRDRYYDGGYRRHYRW